MIRRLICGICIAALVVVAGCSFPGPQRTPPFQGPTPNPVQLAVQPGCHFVSGTSTWRVPLPADGTVPVSAYYSVEDSLGMSPAALFRAGDTITITLGGLGVPWRLHILGADNGFHPITGWIVNPVGTCL